MPEQITQELTKIHDELTQIIQKQNSSNRSWIRESAVIAATISAVVIGTQIFITSSIDRKKMRNEVIFQLSTRQTEAIDKWVHLTGDVIEEGFRFLNEYPSKYKKSVAGTDPYTNGKNIVEFLLLHEQSTSRENIEKKYAQTAGAALKSNFHHRSLSEWHKEYVKISNAFRNWQRDVHELLVEEEWSPTLHEGSVKNLYRDVVDPMRKIQNECLEKNRALMKQLQPSLIQTCQQTRPH